MGSKTRVGNGEKMRVFKKNRGGLHDSGGGDTSGNVHGQNTKSKKNKRTNFETAF